MRLPRSVRTASFRLAVAFVGVFTVSLVTLGACVYWVTTVTVSRRLDGAIKLELASLLKEQAAVGTAGLAAAVERRMISPGYRESLYRLESADGEMLAGNLDERPPDTGIWEFSFVAPSIGSEADETTMGRARTKRLPDGGALTVGRDLERLHDLEDLFLQAFLIVGLAGLAGIGIALATETLSSVALTRRVETVAETARRIIAGDLSQRVPAQESGDEFDRLAQTLNRMLDRIQTLMEDVRRVSDDVAHDLRTPLNRLRHRLERLRQDPATSAGLADGIDRAVADLDVILETFTALLRIAQIEAGARRAGFRSVDLGELFELIAEIYVPVAEDAGKRLTTSVVKVGPIDGDRELLVQMLSNLVENAIRHTQAGAEIGIGVADGASGLVGWVADDGPGVPDASHQKVFERFYRLEASRTTPGNGLGLSLVAAVAELHGIVVRFVDQSPGLRVELQFPPTSCAKRWE